MALVNFSCADSILVESILRESDQQKGFHAAKTRPGHRPARGSTAATSISEQFRPAPKDLAAPFAIVLACGNRLRREAGLAYDYYADSNYSLLVDERMAYEQQLNDFGTDPWRNVFKANRGNLEQFIGYLHDQSLM